MSKTRVLFNWQPSVLDRSLKAQFEQRMADAGFPCQEIEPRDPDYNAVFLDGSKDWHQDPGGSFEDIMWSNVRPTEVRFKDGSLLMTKDGDVILIDNREDEHRAPADQTGRWSIRASLRETSAVSTRHLRCF